jgi:type IV fimbrial biogenesis protein FimT
MKNKKFSHLSNSLSSTLKAFTLIEILIVLIIVSIILAIAINNFQKFRKIYTYQQYISELETAVRMAKLKAVERSVNVSVCADTSSNSVVVYDIGTSRSNTCSSGGNKIYMINIDNSIATVIGTTNGFSFDPRGLGITAGSICIQMADGSMYYKISVQSLSGRINIYKGKGPCT